MTLLSLSCVFPNPSEPGLGVFVRSRLQAIAGSVQVKVISPVALVDYSRRRLRRAESALRSGNASLEVIHPRWFYFPGGLAVNALCLALRLIYPIARLRRRYPFDWIDAHFAYPDGLAAAILARLFRVPFSITLRGNEPMHAARSRQIRALIRWAFPQAACTVTVSESLRQFAIEMGADPATTRTIPNGVDSSIFYPRSRETFRKKVNVSRNQKMIVSAGALIERKGHHHVLRAVSRLVADGADVCLVIIGGAGREGDFSLNLKRMPAELKIENRVVFLGQVTPDQMAEAMSAADLFCLASSREGWPNVVHEAMACGTPVVATNVGGTPEMIPSADYGTVIPKDDQDALDSAIKAGLANSWDRDRIRQWAHSRSWGNVAGEVLELFETSRTAIAKRQ